MEKEITVEFAHICESVIVDKNGSLSIINIFNQIIADNFPAVHPKLTVVIGARGKEGEYDVKIKIKKQGEEQSIVEQPLSTKIKILGSPAQGYLFINVSPLMIKSAGNYEVIISFAGQTKTLFFEAKQVQK